MILARVSFISLFVISFYLLSLFSIGYDLLGYSPYTELAWAILFLPFLVLFYRIFSILFRVGGGRASVFFDVSISSVKITLILLGYIFINAAMLNLIFPLLISAVYWLLFSVVDGFNLLFGSGFSFEKVGFWADKKMQESYAFYLVMIIAPIFLIFMFYDLEYQRLKQLSVKDDSIGLCKNIIETDLILDSLRSYHLDDVHYFRDSHGLEFWNKYTASSTSGDDNLKFFPPITHSLFIIIFCAVLSFILISFLKLTYPLIGVYLVFNVVFFIYMREYVLDKYLVKISKLRVGINE